ncbi:MAG TPA: ComEC/Rec2 family competence protein, partial [Candidatus Saccharimonadales bacterium]|nr:ComEC/Rec2 family competence protein [Candidatus Saccharimonadales bacterium]
VSLGWWRGSQYMLKMAEVGQYYDRKVTITAIAKQDAAYNKYGQLAFDASDVTVVATGDKLAGKYSLSGFGYNAVFAGDEVTATGKLKSSLGSYQGRMSYAQVEVSAHHNSLVNELRRRFTAGMQSALPEPLASFGMGLLIGQRNNLPAAVSQALLMVGLTHIIAVSGYNLTILLRSAERVSGRRSKRLTTLLAFGLIAVFLLFAGNSASIVRAAIVSMLSIAAGYSGRQFKPLVLLLLAAAITGFASPFYVWTDTSWYLSFLAFYGVMVVAPLVSRNWRPRWRESLVVMVALESLCAEVMTLPFILHTFGQMSFIGIVANVVVAALVPLAMLLSLIAGLAGMLLPALVGWLAWPAAIVLIYMLDMVQLLSRIPHVFAQNLGFSTAYMILSYAVIVFLTAVVWWKKKPDNAKITEKASAAAPLAGTALSSTANA